MAGEASPPVNLCWDAVLAGIRAERTGAHQFSLPLHATRAGPVVDHDIALRLGGVACHTNHRDQLTVQGSDNKNYCFVYTIRNTNSHTLRSCIDIDYVSVMSSCDKY